MYLEQPKRQTSLLRILLLIALVAAGVYILNRTGEPGSAVTPTPAPTRTAASYVADAQLAVQAGRLNEAVLALKVALTLEPDNPAIAPSLVRLMIYQSEGRKERKTEVLRVAQRAARSMPDSAPVQAALALALDWNDQTLDAINAGKLATQLDPNYAEGFAFVSEAYTDGQNWARALEAAETAIRLNPGSIDAHRTMGYYLESRGRFGEALTAYQRAMALAPNTAFLYMLLARNYRALGNFDAAIKQYERTLELEPNRGDALDDAGWTHYLTFQAYSRQSDLETAIKELEKATTLSPDYASALAHMGIAYWSRRNYEDAIPALQRAIDLGANKIEYFYILGLAHFYMGQCDKAMPLFQRALVLDPNDVNAQGGVNLCLGVTATPLPATRKP